MASPERLFTVTVITGVEFVGSSSEAFEENYLKHLTEEVEKAAKALSLRSVQGNRVLYCGGGAVPA